MRRALSIIIPLFFAILVFSLAVWFLNKNSGRGALQVTSVPQSDVYLNGKLIGQTPLCKCEQKEMIAKGEYTVKLVPKEGKFDPFEQKITISPSVLTVVDRSFGLTGASEGSIISLSSINDKNDSQIQITSFPNKAEVFLDNNLSGMTPLLLKGITESDHEIRLERSGYKEKTVRIRTVKSYKLEAIIFLAIEPDLSAPTTTSSAVLSPTPVATVSKVLILQTPTGFLRVRDANSLSGKEIARVSPGEKFDFLKEESGWLEIKLSDGQTGWVSSQYAQKEN